LNNIKVPTLLIEGPFQNNLQELICLNQSLSTVLNNKIIMGRLEQLSFAIVEILKIKKFEIK
jgi:hypothetical protein